MRLTQILSPDLPQQDLIATHPNWTRADFNRAVFRLSGRLKTHQSLLISCQWKILLQQRGHFRITARGRFGITWYQIRLSTLQAVVTLFATIPALMGMTVVRF